MERSLAIVVLLLSACGQPGSDEPTDAGVDAGVDAGTVDAGTPVCPDAAAQPLGGRWTVDMNGVERNFDVHLPTGYLPTARSALVLNLHGLGSNGFEQQLLTGFVAKADAEGFVVVHPDGVGESWNAGGCCGTAVQTGVDDVAFVGAMLDELQRELCIDERRIYVTGMSNGGFMSNRLGCDLDDRIAAIAPVAGMLISAPCSPAGPVPVMHFHGTADAVVLYDGVAQFGLPSALESVTGWALRNGCFDTLTTILQVGDSTCETFDGCSDASTVTLCTVDGGGHTWPGGLEVPRLGFTTQAISATDLMWEFFAEHPQP